MIEKLLNEEFRKHFYYYFFYSIMPNECGEGPGEKYYQQLTDLIWSLVHYRAAVDLSQFITDMHQTCGERRAT